MYVKSFGSFENITPEKLKALSSNTNTLRAGGTENPSNVRSFGDDAAYERFSRLGAKGSESQNTDNSRNIPIKTEAVTETENEDSSELYAPALPYHSSSEALLDGQMTDKNDTSNDEIMSPESEKSENNITDTDKSKLLSEIEKLLYELPLDVPLIIAVLLLVISKSKDDGDVITPLSLAAILF